MTAPRRLVTVKDLSERWTLAESTLYAWRKAGRGPRSFKLGGRVVYDEVEAEQWLEQQQAASSSGGVA